MKLREDPLKDKCLQNIRLIALDLDGTTLTRAGLTRRTRETLEEAIEKGIDVAIATGRPFVALPEDVLKIKGLKHIIISNGAHIMSPEGEFCYSNYVQTDAIEQVRQILMKHDFPVEVFTGGGAYVDEDLYNDLKENGSTYMGYKYILRTRKPVPHIYEFWENHIGEIENINIHFEDLNDREEMRQLLKTLPGISVTHSQPHNLEVIADTTSKATALRVLCGMKGIDMEHVIAFGDSANDYEMIAECGYSVAMGNAEEFLKEHADFIAPTNEEEGVAYMIRTGIFGRKF